MTRQVFKSNCIYSYHAHNTVEIIRRQRKRPTFHSVHEILLLVLRNISDDCSRLVPAALNFSSYFGVVKNVFEHCCECVCTR